MPKKDDKFFDFEYQDKIFQEFSNRPIPNGMVIQETCSCDNYVPYSTKGVINLNCGNCGGRQPNIVAG